MWIGKTVVVNGIQFIVRDLLNFVYMQFQDVNKPNVSPVRVNKIEANLKFGMTTQRKLPLGMGDPVDLFGQWSHVTGIQNGRIATFCFRAAREVEKEGYWCRWCLLTEIVCLWAPETPRTPSWDLQCSLDAFSLETDPSKQNRSNTPCREHASNFLKADSWYPDDPLQGW